MSNPEGPDPRGVGYGNLDQLRAKLAESLQGAGIDPNILDQGSAHSYSCTCETCWNWWRTMGLGDEDEAPFTQMELDQDTYEDARNVFPSVEVVGLPERVWEQHRKSMRDNPCKYDNHAWVADPIKARHYTCRLCGLEHKP